MRVYYRWLLVATAAIGLTVSTPVSVLADPLSDAPGAPFPSMSHITTWYNQQPAEQFFLPDHPGVWFMSPSGLNCGIWVWGSFGCMGNIPGAPPGDDHIAWYNGNRGVHHGWTAAIQFPAGQAQQTLPPRSYVTYESTTCAITPENETYCGRGDFQFLISQTQTLYKGWDDKRSYVCLSYGSC